MKNDDKHPPFNGPRAPKAGRAGWILTVVVGVWMFFLGLLIGRGNIGPQFDTRQIENELETLKQEFIKKQEKLSELIKKQTESPQDANLFKALEAAEDHPKAIELIPPEILEKKKQEQLALEAQMREAGAITEAGEEAGETVPETAGGDPNTAVAAITPPITPIPQPPAAPPHPPAPTVTPAPTPPPKPETTNVTIQVASVQDPEVALKLVTDLKRKGFSAYTTPVYLAGKGVWYRVRVGKFSHSPEAQEVLKHLGASGHSGVIVKP